MNDWFDNGFILGMSATLFYWFAIGTSVMARLCWQQRKWFCRWFKISVDARCDAALNLSLFMLFVSLLLSRAITAWFLLKHGWQAPTLVLVFTQGHLPWALGGCALFLWWAMFRLSGARWRWWWCFFMWTGLAIGVIVSFVF